MKYNYEKLSNSELKLKLKVLNDEFELIKTEVANKVKKMDLLNNEYIECNKILNKRTNGKMIF